MLNNFGGAPAPARYLMLQIGEAGQKFAIRFGEYAANPIGQCCINQRVRPGDHVADFEKASDVEVHAVEIDAHSGAIDLDQLRQRRVEALEVVELLAEAIALARNADTGCDLLSQRCPVGGAIDAANRSSH